jgi:EAL domain-containing protein (putative c-di-GMP-specific phosphodiesterase class I)
MHQETRSRESVKAVIGLSKSLNLKVVTEGIESNEQLKLLRDMGCAYGQGFYFSIPLNGDDAKQ